jgi:hypothetical protein
MKKFKLKTKSRIHMKWTISKGVREASHVETQSLGELACPAGTAPQWARAEDQLYHVLCIEICDRFLLCERSGDLGDRLARVFLDTSRLLFFLIYLGGEFGNWIYRIPQITCIVYIILLLGEMSRDSRNSLPWLLLGERIRGWGKRLLVLLLNTRDALALMGFERSLGAEVVHAPLAPTTVTSTLSDRAGGESVEVDDRCVVSFALHPPSRTDLLRAERYYC